MICILQWGIFNQIMGTIQLEIISDQTQKCSEKNPFGPENVRRLNAREQPNQEYLHAKNTSTHLQHTHHSSLHSIHHTGRNRDATVSQCTK